MIKKPLQVETKPERYPEALFKINTPVYLGGLGLREMSTICNAAYLACWLETLRHIWNIFGEEMYFPNHMIKDEVVVAFRQTQQQLPRVGPGEGPIPDTLDECMDTFIENAPSKLQREMVKKIEGHMVRSYSLQVAHDCV